MLCTCFFYIVYKFSFICKTKNIYYLFYKMWRISSIETFLFCICVILFLYITIPWCRCRLYLLSYSCFFYNFHLIKKIFEPCECILLHCDVYIFVVFVYPFLVFTFYIFTVVKSLWCLRLLGVYILWCLPLFGGYIFVMFTPL